MRKENWMRKGYWSEYTTRKKLEKEFGSQNVLKLAIGQSADFIVLCPERNAIEKIVEVKKRAGKYYKASDKKQHCSIIRLAQEHNVKYELWVAEKGRHTRVEVLYEPEYYEPEYVKNKR